MYSNCHTLDKDISRVYIYIYQTHILLILEMLVDWLISLSGKDTSPNKKFGAVMGSSAVHDVDGSYQDASCHDAGKS